MNNYFLEIDRFRISLHVLRCFMHLSVPFMVMPSEIWPFRSVSNHSELYDGFVFFVHVGVMESFFVLNGFFAIQLLSKKTVTQFLMNRFRRIFIPFLLGMVILIPFILHLGLCYKNKLPVSFGSFQLVIEYYRTNPYNFGHLWSLWYLMIIYLMLLVFEIRTTFLTSQIRKLSLFYMSLLVITVTSLSLFFFDKKYTLLPIDRLVDWQMLIYYFLFFCFGIWFYENREKIQHMKVPKLLYVIAILAIIVNILYQKSESQNWLFHLFGKFAYAVHAYTVIFILYNYIKNKNIVKEETIKNLSQNMYWLYWIEVPIAIMIHYYFVDKAHPILIVLFGGIFTIVTSILSYNFLFKNKRLGKVLGFSN